MESPKEITLSLDNLRFLIIQEVHKLCDGADLELLRKLIRTHNEIIGIEGEEE